MAWWVGGVVGGGERGYWWGLDWFEMVMMPTQQRDGVFRGRNAFAVAARSCYEPF